VAAEWPSYADFVDVVEQVARIVEDAVGARGDQLLASVAAAEQTDTEGARSPGARRSHTLSPTTIVLITKLPSDGRNAAVLSFPTASPGIPCRRVGGREHGP
jgi:hypothetical protein